MLKAKGVTVIFEKENIDTSTMESEMQLSLISALAQNEVESLSQNVSLGVQMKMSRGELMGFNGCLGYDYHPEDKSISVNEQEADTVRMIYDLYVQGYGAYTIAKELAPLYWMLLRTVRYCSSRLMSCQVRPATSPMRSPVKYAI